jgi:hypothetical protein
MVMELLAFLFLGCAVVGAVGVLFVWLFIKFADRFQ